MVIAVDGPGFRRRDEELVQLVWTADNVGACEYTVCMQHRGQGVREHITEVTRGHGVQQSKANKNE